MGADGGVEWVRLRKGVEFRAAYDLVEPFWNYLNNMGGSVYEDSREDWLGENREPGCLYSGYGTEMEEYGWRAFGDFIQELQEAVTDWRGLSSGATFTDYLEEIDTRPEGFWVGYREKYIQHWIRCLRENADDEFLSRPVVDWLRAVYAAFETRTSWGAPHETRPDELTFELEVESEETWT